MKIVNFFSQLISSIILVGFLIYFLTGYDSAFEADQLCHSFINTYDPQSANYACDHDTETHQWILYDDLDKTKPAKIIKKFRYKFL